MQRSGLLTFVLAAAWAFAASGLSVAQSDDTLKSLRDKVLQADNLKSVRGAPANRIPPWTVKAEAYEALFKKFGKSGLRDLMKDEDTSIALQAAWEEHKKLIKNAKQPEYPDWVDSKYDKEAL